MPEWQQAYLSLFEVLGKKVRQEQVLAPFTSFRVGGPARLFVEAENIYDLKVALKTAQQFGLPWFILGRGTNLLVSDDGFDGLVLRMSLGFSRFLIEGEKIVSGAAVPLPELVWGALNNSLDGLSFAVGIPGSLGGAVKMNAGAFDKEIGPLVNRLTVLDSSLELKNLHRSELTFGYRSSSINEVILEVELSLKPGDEKKIREQMEKNFRLRKKNQPQGCFSAGSIFKNPPGEKAFRLIESVGAKGLRVGKATVSSKHANFIVNLGGASSADIYSLIKEVRERVWNKYNILLELEIELLGRFENGNFQGSSRGKA